jgi:hypothetical protein
LKKKNIASIILLVVLISVFVSVFFFTYAYKVEGDIEQEQINYIISDLTNDIKSLFPSEIVKEIKLQMSKVTLPDMTEEDHKTDTNNKSLYIKSIIIFSIILIIGIGIFYYYSKVNDIDMYQIIKKNLIILLFVALTEFIFLLTIPKNYKVVDPNFVKKIFIESLESFLSRH